MPKQTIVTTGDRKTDRRLKRLKGPEQKKAISKSSRSSIKPIGQQAKSSAKEHKQTGQSAKSYKVRAMKRSRSRVGSRVTTDQKSFPGAFKTKFQELGWKAGRARTKQPGHQDLKKSAQTKKQQTLREFHAGIKQFILSTTRA